MSNVNVKMRMSPAKAGALYMKSIRLEDKVDELTKKLKEIQGYSNGVFDDESEMADALYNINCVLLGE